MSIKELKIGDLVSFTINYNTYGNIEGFENNNIANIKSISKDINDLYSVFIEDLYPVKLTTSILMHNGWKIVKHVVDEDNFEWITYEKESSSIQLEYYPETNQFSSFTYGTELIEIKYVHELQHLLWSMKEDDNLKL